MTQSAFTVEQRDPVMLRPHPAIKSMPRWAKGTDAWHAFVQDIKTAGITHPLLVTAKNVVVDGETRRLAAVSLQMPEVPCQIVEEDQVHTIILRELGLKRQLTKGQLAYCAVPHLEGAFQEAAKRQTAGLKKGDSPVTNSVRHGVSARSIEDFATSKGISVRYLQIARDIVQMLATSPEFTTGAEDRIFDPENPAGLGAVKAWLGSQIAQRDRESAGQRHGGGRPGDAGRQLDLFVDVFETESKRWEYWEAFDPDTREEAWRRLRTRFETLSVEERFERSRFHSRIARELKGKSLPA